MKKIYSIIFLLMFVTSVVNAANRFSVASGNWDATSTWSATSGGSSGASVPVLGDNVFIEGGFDVTVTADAECDLISIAATGSILTVNAAITLNVTTSITLQNSNTANTAATLQGAGTINCASLQIGGTVTAPTADRTTILTSTITTLGLSGNLTVRSEDNGSSQGNATFNLGDGAVTVGGTVILDADSDGGPVPTSTLSLNTGAETGTLSIGGATPFSTPGGGTVVFAANGNAATVNYTGGTQTIFATTYTNLILSGSGAKTTTGVTVNTKLTLQGAATVGNVITYATAILEYNGSSAQTTSVNEFSDNNANIDGVIINNTSGVTLNDATTLNGSNLTLTSGTFATGTNLTIGATGTPIITRSEGSITGTIQGTDNYNVIYTGNTKTTGPELENTGLMDVDVNLTTGQTLTLDANRSPDGDVTIIEGIFDISTFTINRSAAGGAFDINDGGWLKIGGTNSFPANYGSSTIGNTDATVEYAGTAQTVATLPSDSYTNVVLSGSGVKTFAAETIIGTLSIQGTATTAGGFTYGGSAMLEYKGSSAQTTSAVEFPSAMNSDVIINNANGVSLNGAKTLSGNLTLTNGLLTTTSTNLLTLASGFSALGYSDNSFVNGPMAKIGATAFTFPVGKSGAGLHTIGIGTPSASSTFNAEYFRANPQTAVGSAKGAGIDHLSACEYWVLNRTAGAGNATVILSWETSSNCSAANYVSNLATLRVARWTGALWEDRTNASTTGGIPAGTVTSNTVTSFSPFALASSNNTTNPLPVKLSNIRAFEKQQGIQIDWTAYQEENLSRYSVERSADGITFISIGEVTSRNSAVETNYGFFDASPVQGVNFYRLKSIDFDNKYGFSIIVKVNLDKSVKDISLYPNPATGGFISFQGANLAKGNYTVRVYNSAGMQVMGQNFTHTGGAINQTLQLPNGIKPGMYSLQLVSDGVKLMSKSFIVQ